MSAGTTKYNVGHTFLPFIHPTCCILPKENNRVVKSFKGHLMSTTTSYGDGSENPQCAWDGLLLLFCSVLHWLNLSYTPLWQPSCVKPHPHSSHFVTGTTALCQNLKCARWSRMMAGIEPSCGIDLPQWCVYQVWVHVMWILFRWSLL